MEDTQIVELFWQRKEEAIAQSQRKFGNYCHCIAYRILENREDSAECVNSTWWKAWNAMPPHRPRVLASFFGKITRNLALNQWEKSGAGKRGGRQVALALEELEDCIPDQGNPTEDRELAEALNTFLADLPAEKRKLFVSRYWGMMSIGEIAKANHLTEANVKTLLHRTREQLRKFLEQEGIAL